MDKKPSGLRARWKTMYHRSSIQLILSIAFTAVAVIGMLFLGMALLLRFSSSANEMAGETSQRVLEQVNWSLDSYLRSMMRVSDTVYYRVIKNADLEQSGTEQELRDALELLYAKDRDVLVSLALFDSDGGLISATPLTELKNSVTPSREEWFTAAMERIENLHFSTPHVQNLFEDPDSRYHWVVSLSRHVELTGGGVIRSGVLLVDMNFSGIEQICKDVSFSDGQGYLYLIDRNGEIIYHPRQQLIYAGLLEENNQAAAAYSDGTYTEVFRSQRRQVTVKTVGYTGWKLVGVAPTESLRDNYSQLLLFALFVVSLSIFLLVFVNLRLSEWITAPMKKLDLAVRQLEKGAETADFDVDGPYEVEHLSHSVQSMVSTMRHLMEDVIQQEEEKRRSELDVLQSQINPHFLYNTLSMMNWMAIRSGQMEISKVTLALSTFYRTALSKGEDMVTVETCIRNMEAYLEIQLTMHDHNFTVEWETDPDIKNEKMPKLLLQPVVENAIEHGIDEKEEGDKKLFLSFKGQGDDVEIIVRDNGTGMEQEKAETLVTYQAKGYGLKNVNDRIRLLYGESYGIQIYSAPGEGTTVIMRFPKEIRNYEE